MNEPAYLASCHANGTTLTLTATDLVIGEENGSASARVSLAAINAIQSGDLSYDRDRLLSLAGYIAGVSLGIVVMVHDAELARGLAIVALLVITLLPNTALINSKALIIHIGEDCFDYRVPWWQAGRLNAFASALNRQRAIVHANCRPTHAVLQ